jgi:microcystin-dependent protein
MDRTTYSALFSAIGTTYGAADGVTYFALPDLRGRVPVGMDNMGGTYAGRISGVVAGTTLGAGGGDQWLHAHGHGVTVNDTIHTHGISDPGHAHAVNDPGHVHAQSGTVLDNVADGVSVKATAGNGYNFRQYNTQSNAAGVGIFPAATGVTVNAAATGVNSGTALVNGAGAGQNVQPSLICNHIIFAGV